MGRIVTQLQQASCLLKQQFGFCCVVSAPAFWYILVKVLWSALREILQKGVVKRLVSALREILQKGVVKRLVY